MCVELWSELSKLGRVHKLEEQKIFLSPFKYGNQNVPKGDVLIFSVSGLKKSLNNGNAKRSPNLLGQQVIITLQ